MISPAIDTVKFISINIRAGSALVGHVMCVLVYQTATTLQLAATTVVRIIRTNTAIRIRIVWAKAAILIRVIWNDPSILIRIIFLLSNTVEGTIFTQQGTILTC